MSKDRVISGAIMIVLTIVALLNDWMCLFYVMMLTAGALYEFFHLIKKKGIPIYSYTGLIIGCLIPLAVFFQFEPTKSWEMLFIVFALLTVFFMQFMRNDNSNAIVGISTTLFGVLYVSWFFSFLIKIRFMMPGQDGINLLIFILLVTKCGDVGALLFGKLFGKTPLLPRVSPNKTLEGSLGGFAISAVVAFLAQNLIPSIFEFSLGHIIVIGIFFGGLGQVGDMSESLIKRDCNVKDSGKMLPALGGVLDTIDSLLFSAPAFYYYMSATLRTMAAG
jgi:phosphatidate cytidylyltransferase